MSLEVYEDDDATLVDDLAITNYEAGADSDVLTVHVWNAKDDALAQPLTNVVLVLRTESPTTAGLYLATGLPPQDERWGRARIVGYDNTGDPSWSVANTAWQSLGAYAGLTVGEIPANCAVYSEIKLRPPSTAEANTWRHRLTGYYDEHAIALPPALTYVDRGILTGVGDYERSGLINGGAVTPTGTPDDEVHIAPVTWLYQGRIYADITQDVTLSQNDVAAAALTVGQSYWACLSLAAGATTTTKGAKGASPTRPTQPAGSVLLAWVRVDYDAGGGAIAAADIDLDDVTYDRHLLVDDGGLDAILHPGRAIGGGTFRWHSQAQTITFADNDTSYVWQLATGLYEVTLTETPPEDGALGPWWEVTTSAGDITAILDRRTFAGDVVVVEVGGLIPGSPGTISTVPVLYPHLEVDAVVTHWSDNGAGASGLTRLDLEVNSTTIYTDSGTEDLRPTLAYNASTLLEDDSRPQVRTLRYGDTLELLSITHPTGGTPDSVVAYVICRRGN